LRHLLQLSLLVYIVLSIPACGEKQSSYESTTEWSRESALDASTADQRDKTEKRSREQNQSIPEPQHEAQREVGTKEAVEREQNGQETLPDTGLGFEQQRTALQKRYGITLSLHETFPIKTTHGPIGGKDAVQTDIESYGALFFPEWQLYPTTLIKRARLTKIVFCTDLSFNGQPRTAIPDLEHNVLYFDVAKGRHSKEYVRRTIHHEFFHIIDWYDDFKLYSDQAWSALNEPGFTYGSGGKDAQGDSSGSLLTDTQPGFFTKYSLSGVEEDKAEVYSIMIVLSSAAHQRSQTDSIIAAKMKQMKQLLKTFVPDMDDAFWQAAAALPRP